MGLGVVTAFRCAQSLGFGESVGGLFLVLVGAALIGLVGAKLDSLLERGSVEPLLWELRNGYRYPGAVIGLAVAGPFLVRVRGMGASVLAFGDIVAPAAGVALAVVRIGCFLAGCCHGTLSEAWWAVGFPPRSFAWMAQVSAGLIRADAPASLPVHPLQLYFALWSFGLGVFLLRFAPRRTYEGQVLLAYLALDNLMKFLLESLREPSAPHLRWSSLAIGLVTLGFLLVGWLRRWTTAPVVPPARAAAPHHSNGFRRPPVLSRRSSTWDSERSTMV